jgi:hypothetical protein
MIFMLNNEMNKDDLSLQQIYQEMALSNLQKIGKWGDKKNRHGYDKASIGILSSPAGLKKLENSFNRIGNWDFNLYFVKLPNAWKHAEEGKVSVDEVRSRLGLEVGKDFPQPEGDQITVFFTNNAAAEKVPLTPWTIAHRIGHAFARTFRIFRDGNNNQLLDYNNKNISQILRQLMECYGIQTQKDLRNSSEYYIRDLYQKIGKFRSARMGKLIRPAEFYHEAFAYWLLHDGELDFNDPPKFLQDSNKKAWGNPTGRNYMLKDEDGATELVHQLRYALEEMFHTMVGEHMGEISIM